MKKVKRLLALVLVFSLVFALSGCENTDSSQDVKLDPQAPITLSVWHYYNGAVLNAFEELVLTFNETVGKEMGIIVEGSTLGNPGEMEEAIIASINKEIGSRPVPNIFASYADTAYAVYQKGALASLDEYLTDEELAEYIDSFVEEGRIGANGELMIFPIAKSTELLLLNDTDWAPFAAECGIDYSELETIEGVVNVAKQYYDYSGGRAFFGRDAMANFFIIASKEFGVEIFEATEGDVNINVDEDVMKKIWDNYYVPYINGYFTAYGRFRSDDVRIGDILAYVGSTASSSYFPKEVTFNDESYPIESIILPAPSFADGEKVMVQQGAGMVVTKATPQEEYASVVFLKWLTEEQNNIAFSALSGYMPVKKAASDYDTFIKLLGDSVALDSVTDATLKVAFDGIKTSRLYTNKAFRNGVDARAVLENHLQNKAVDDKESILKMVEEGEAREDAVALFDTEENFRDWLEDFIKQLNQAAFGEP